MKKDNNKNRFFLIALGIGLLFPLFFQFSGKIYNSAHPIIDSGGLLTTLPIPISIFACFGGLSILLGDNYRRAFLGWMFVSGLLFFMLVSLIFSEMNMGVDRRKVILMFQYLLPAFGLILGQMIVDDERYIPRAFLYTLFFVVPIQLICGWVQGSFALTHNLYLFSIYSHIQYVPLILVCAFSYAMVTLWDSHTRSLCILAFLMLIYVLASASFLTIFAYMTFIIVFIFTRIAQPLINIKMAIIFAVLIVMGLAIAVEGLHIFYEAAKGHYIMENVDGSYINKFNDLSNGKLPQNVQERLDIWKLYIGAIAESTNTLIFGHNAPLPREIKSSAHNWFLDIAHTFGLISLLPMFLLIGYTIHRLWQSKQTLSGETLWLAVIVFYLVVVDNNFKVSMRQPYPGIFAYFLWGLLLSYLPYKRMQERSGL